MAKFDKDIFLADITDRVKDAIESGLISQEDINNDDVDRLVGFIQYVLSEYIEDRKNAIDILKNFNYDERYAWSALEKQIGGEIKSLFDVALANLWKFLESSGLLTYAYYIEGTTPEASKASPIISKYSDDEFEEDNDLMGEINDEEFEDEDYETPNRKEWWEEDDFEDNSNDDYKYGELVRKRQASSRRNFRSR